MTGDTRDTDPPNDSHTDFPSIRTTDGVESGAAHSDDETIVPTSQADSDTQTFRKESKSLPEKQPESGGRLFGEYELLGEIARGGMGVVYKARQVRLNRVVALKMIRSGRLADDEEIQRFQREAEAAAKLEHPNIVPIYEVGESDGQHFFSMGFVDGPPLSDLIEDGPLPAKQAAELTRTIANAVQYAHEQGIVHRDLKPANVLLASIGREPADGADDTRTGSTSTQPGGLHPPLAFGVPRITDFGLAKNITADTGMTATGQIMGTPSYMPPEQAAGETEKIGPLVDVYSIGAMLYCQLTGRPPFQSANQIDTMRQVLENEPVPPRQLNPAIPRDLDTICLKCLEKTPAKRYASATALADDLGRFLDNRPILARPIGTLNRFGRWCKRNPLVATLTAAVLAASIVGTLVAWSFAIEADARATDFYNEQIKAQQLADNYKSVAAKETKERQAKVAALKKVTAKQKELNEQLETTGIALYGHKLEKAQRLIEANDVLTAMTVLESCEETHRAWEWRFLMARCRRRMQVLVTPKPPKSHPEGVRKIRFLSDGKRFVTAGKDRITRIWDPAKKTNRAIATTRMESRIAVDPRGRFIAITDDSAIQIWSFKEQRITQTLAGHRQMVRSLDFHPDGRILATSSTDQMVHLWNPADGKRIKSIPISVRYVGGLRFSPDGKQIACFGRGVRYRDGRKTPSAVVLNVKTGKPVFTLPYGNFNFNSVEWSADGKLLAAANLKSVQIRDAATGAIVRELTGHISHVWGAIITPDGKQVVSHARGNDIRIFDLKTGVEIEQLRSPFEALTLAVHPKGTHFAWAGADRRVVVWNRRPTDFELVAKVPALSYAVAFSPNGRLFAWQALEGSGYYVKILDTQTGKTRILPEKISSSIHQIGLTPDGRYLYFGADSRQATVWDTNTWEPVRSFKAHRLSVSPDGTRAITGHKDGSYAVWDMKTGKQLRSARPAKRWTSWVDYSPDGKRELSVTDEDHVIRVRDSQTGEEVFALPVGNTVHQVRYSPNGKWLAASIGRWHAGGQQAAGEVRVWEAATGKQVHSLKGHRGMVMTIAFSPDSSRVYSCSWDQTVRVWHLKTGHELLSFNPHQHIVHAVAVSKTGIVATTSEDGTVRFWRTGDRK